MTQVTATLLHQMVQAIVEELDPEQVILFGSRARAHEGEDTEVDLGVVETEPFGKTRSRRMEAFRLWRTLTRFVVPKNIHVYSHDEVEFCRGSLTHVLVWALREGRILHERP